MLSSPTKDELKEAAAFAYEAIDAHASGRDAESPMRWVMDEHRLGGDGDESRLSLAVAFAFQRTRDSALVAQIVDGHLEVQRSAIITMMLSEGFGDDDIDVGRKPLPKEIAAAERMYDRWEGNDTIVARSQGRFHDLSKRDMLSTERMVHDRMERMEVRRDKQGLAAPLPERDSAVGQRPAAQVASRLAALGSGR